MYSTIDIYFNIDDLIRKQSEIERLFEKYQVNYTSTVFVGSIEYVLIIKYDDPGRDNGRDS